MPTVILRFPGGRYHATPWGHHVNEGMIEWPPSPWRLLRALIACGFTSQSWIEIPPVARQLINKMAAVLPLYRLPPASAAHSRHFMPTIEGKLEKPTLVFDTWANVGNGELLIHWPCDLSAEETELLTQLVSSLGYLGRSESWVEAQLINNDFVDWNAVPSTERGHRGPGWEQVSLMAAVPPEDYDKCREAQIQEALQPFQGQKQTAPVKKKQLQAIEPYPMDLLSCLTKDTSWWKGFGWSQPPGSQRVLYWRRSDALQVGIPTLRRPLIASSITTMLLAITSRSGNKSALPPVTRILPQAELLHRAIIARLGDGSRVICPELTGKDEFDRPHKNQHQHAHTIPIDLDDDGHLDHIVIYAPMGLGDAAQRAIRTLRRTWTKGGTGDLQIAVVGNGDLEVLRRFPPPLNLVVDRFLGPTEGAQIWESSTPFVLPRYLKRKGKDTLEGQVQAELESRGLPRATLVEYLPELTKALRHFSRRRTRSGALPKMDSGYGLRLAFERPVHGPLILGYASHYGLGRFNACKS